VDVPNVIGDRLLQAEAVLHTAHVPLLRVRYASGNVKHGSGSAATWIVCDTQPQPGGLLGPPTYKMLLDVRHGCGR
jgi:hypothetical protein